MKRVRIAVVGAGNLAQWGIVPVLSGPDVVSPPDTGAWWARRADAASSSQIRYQPPARPEIVAICDIDRARATQLAEIARVRAVYADWRVLLREVELDAVVCAANAKVAREIALVLPSHCRLWIEALPSFSLEGARHLETQLRGRNDKIWCARLSRQSSAHRAARQLVERDQIGAPSALSLRWSAPFSACENSLSDATANEPNANASANANMPSAHASSAHAAKSNAPSASEKAASSDSSPRNSSRKASSGNAFSKTNAPKSNLQNALHDDPQRVASSFAALDLLGSFAALASSTRNANVASCLSSGEIWARENGGATQLMIQFGNGATATALFCGAETWSAPLPRLEICGTQGRFLLCEAGRRLWLHHPREAARFWEPPGLSHHVSSANINGLAEDFKEFLAWCAESKADDFRQDDFRQDDLRQAAGASLAQAASILPLWDAASRSLRENRVVSWNAPTSHAPASHALSPNTTDKTASFQPTLSLPL